MRLHVDCSDFGVESDVRQSGSFGAFPFPVQPQQQHQQQYNPPAAADKKVSMIHRPPFFLINISHAKKKGSLEYNRSVE